VKPFNCSRRQQLQKDSWAVGAFAVLPHDEQASRR
jgi:hypothetical protein